jgi:hypothetical protein
MADAGQAPTANPRDSDGDGIPNFRDLDSNADGTPDIAGSGHTSLDANGDGRIDAGADSDGDGILDQADSAPQVIGTVIDGDGDGVPDVADLDLDNDGIPNDADGSDDTDGDGQPNLADLDSDGDGIMDLVEAGGVDSNDDGLADNLIDTNGNGIADAFEPSLGGAGLDLPDSDRDGVDNHRDLDSDGDGSSDVIESGGVDADDDGRLDAGAPKPSMPDSDGDGMRDLLDTDSDNDSIPDSREGRSDSDGDGIPDSLDQPGNLQTAIRGTGAFEPLSLAGLLALAAWLVVRRTGRRQLARVLPAVALVLLGVHGADALAGDLPKDPVSRGFYLGVDVGMSRLEPRNSGGGYVVDDKSDMGYRLNFGYAFSRSWAAELFYADGGKAGIASDNPAVGHLGDIEYRMWGIGAEWAPLEGGRDARWFPVVKLGAVQIDNRSTSSFIQYEKLNDVGVYLGGGMGLRLGKTWTARGEVVSYDQDELFFTLGMRKRF